MFSRQQPCRTDRQRPIRTSKPETSVRIGALVFPFLLLILLAFTTPKCVATPGTTENEGGTTSGVNLASEVRGTIPRDTGSQPASASDNSGAEESDAATAFTAGHYPSGENDSPSGVLGGDQKKINPASPMKCLVFQESLCRALRNRPIAILAAIQTGALISDGVTTRQFLHRGYTEVDPLARILIGSKPTWARMAPLGAVHVVAGMWLAERMASSHHVWVRRFWWLPQMLGIAGNAAATAHNVALR
jgi:hypothetical protein